LHDEDFEIGTIDPPLTVNDVAGLDWHARPRLEEQLQVVSPIERYQCAPIAYGISVVDRFQEVINLSVMQRGALDGCSELGETRRSEDMESPGLQNAKDLVYSAWHIEDVFHDILGNEGIESVVGERHPF